MTLAGAPNGEPQENCRNMTGIQGRCEVYAFHIPTIFLGIPTIFLGIPSIFLGIPNPLPFKDSQTPREVKRFGPP